MQHVIACLGFFVLATQTSFARLCCLRCGQTREVRVVNRDESSDWGTQISVRRSALLL